MQPQGSVTVSPTQFAIRTRIGEFPTPADSGKQTGVAQVATNDALAATEFAATDTAIAMTPAALRPTATTIPPPPTDTDVMGLYFPQQPPHFGYITTNAWQGIVDGQLGGVVGAARRDYNTMQASVQGVVLVYAGRFLLGSYYAYDTPINAGPMMITAVEGDNFTLAEVQNRPDRIVSQVGGSSVVFNLTSRQFLAATCGTNSQYPCTPVALGTTTPASTPAATTQP